MRTLILTTLLLLATSFSFGASCIGSCQINFQNTGGNKVTFVVPNPNSKAKNKWIILGTSVPVSAPKVHVCHCLSKQTITARVQTRTGKTLELQSKQKISNQNQLITLLFPGDFS